MAVIAQALVVVVVVVVVVVEVAAWSRGMTGTPRRPESITHIESSFRIIASVTCIDGCDGCVTDVTDVRISSTLITDTFI
jgi:hypothetical protein